MPGSSLLSTLRLFAMVSLALVVACGGKTALRQPRGHDGGPEIDGGPAAELVVDCGRRDRYGSPRQPITLEATATSPDGVVRTGWTTTAAPAGSLATNDPTAGSTTTLVPDATGDYELRFDATDGAGRTASCSVVVHSVVGPPVAICPEEELFRMPSGVPITIVGDAYDDLGVASISWAQIEGPSMARLTPVGAGGGAIEFVADEIGLYVLELRVIDTDGATDACTVQVRVTAPPEAICPGEPIRAPTRQPVTVTASGRDDGAIVAASWEMIERPDGSTAALARTSGESTSFVPDRLGEYRLRFTVTDDDGGSASCEVTVIGTPTPPEAMCPDVVETAPLAEVEVVASAVDDGTITSWAWRLVGAPPGARPAEPSPADRPATRFRPDLAGDYTLRLTVIDDDGDTDECETIVRAISSDGLRVEVFWDTDGTDMDTHLLRPGATAWFTDADCYYGNCNAGGGAPILHWFGPSEDDDPRLDIDDVDGFGPENINITRPAPGRYRVGVHAFRGFARVTVRVYCGGSTTEPRQTFGPVALDDRRLWRVADVDVTGSGCTITDLAIGGRPNTISDDESRRMP